MIHDSIWSSIHAPEFPPLRTDAEVDVCVVGAGIAGLSTAYALVSEGKRVIVIDRGSIGGGETVHTSAHLSNAIDARYYVIRRLHGDDGARVCAASHTAAIDQIEEIVQTENIDCNFERVDGYLFCPPGESTDVLKEELDAARMAGVPSVEWRSQSLWPATGPCLCFGGQAQFNPMKYLVGLAQAVVRRGGAIYGQTEMRRVGSRPLRVETVDGPIIRASAIVIATHTPVIDRVVIHAQQAAHRTYMIAIRMPRNNLPRALYWDTTQEAGEAPSAPYHYVRVADIGDGNGNEELLVVGGEDHKTGQVQHPEHRWLLLEDWARKRIDGLGEVAYRWSGQILEPFDRVAFIGPNPGGPEGVYIVTGDSGMGLTHGAIAGLMLPKLIDGQSHPWAALYNPSRITLRSGWEFTKESWNVAMQYSAWLRPGEVTSELAIAPGSGAIIRRSFALCAAYCDDAGELHECSAVCPHMGGIVAWNSAEHTWDCPCHGSRFEPLGSVICGPATEPLKRIDESTRLSVASRAERH